MSEIQNMCKGCGECCRKGGPLLHLEDMPLLRRGHVPFTALVTLRGGELVHDPVRDALLPLEEEAVKVAGTGESAHPWHCVFHKGKRCSIHEGRPAQCRALFCTDTGALEAMYGGHRATRREVLAHAPAGWLELAEAHEEQCSLRPLVPLAAQWEEAEAARALLECLRYDLAFRELSVERAGVPEAALFCVLGRPVTEFLRVLGLAASKDAADNLTLHRVGESRYPW